VNDRGGQSLNASGARGRKPRSKKGLDRKYGAAELQTSAMSAPVRNMRFECRVSGDETYDIYVRNLPDDFYA
jgi:hypothetical protein